MIEVIDQLRLLAPKAISLPSTMGINALFIFKYNDTLSDSPGQGWKYKSELEGRESTIIKSRIAFSGPNFLLSSISLWTFAYQLLDAYLSRIHFTRSGLISTRVIWYTNKESSSEYSLSYIVSMALVSLLSISGIMCSFPGLYYTTR